MAEQQLSAPARAQHPVPGTKVTAGVTHVRHRHTERFTVVGNHLAQHGELSLTAIGLAVHIQSLPDGAGIGIKRLTSRFREGEVAIARALRELEAYGYLARVRERTVTGRWVTRTLAHDKPCEAGGPESERGPDPGPERGRSGRVRSGWGPREPVHAEPHRPGSAQPAPELGAAPRAGTEQAAGYRAVPGQETAPRIAPPPPPEPIPVPGLPAATSPALPGAQPGALSRELPVSPPPVLSTTLSGVQPQPLAPELSAAPWPGLSAASPGAPSPLAAPPSGPPSPFSPAAPSPAVPSSAPSPEHRPAAGLLASLRGRDPRLLLTARDIAHLAPAVTAWFDRGITAEDVTRTLADDLPAGVLRKPAAVLAYRITNWLPPALPSAPAAPAPDPLQTCDGCERAHRAPEPGRCRDCRHEGKEARSAHSPAEVDVA